MFLTLLLAFIAGVVVSVAGLFLGLPTLVIIVIAAVVGFAIGMARS